MEPKSSKKKISTNLDEKVAKPKKGIVPTTTGDNIEAPNAGWSFGGNVAKTFDDHVSKSVPLYQEGHDLICKASDYFLSDNSVVCDLGTSTGELLLKLAKRHDKRQNLRLIGLDREQGMIDEAKRKCKSDPRIQFECVEIVEAELEKTDFIVAYYMMQFIRPAFRQDVFNRIYNSLQWGGAFLFFEKVRGPDARFQDIISGLYTDYKLEKGYSSEEIIAKSRSLKGVLEPFSTEGNYDLLKRAGFKDIMTIMKYICFEGILAIK
ncbi:MAG: methyltransferase domain-containing protein [Leptospiraceae bacterium]|nr:methyltransferase domain-containing protein [Leptospiraceae bacterium]MCP5496543.1 methyltransferase domain-containing protein [Leptospiraceae bacterium]